MFLFDKVDGGYSRGKMMMRDGIFDSFGYIFLSFKDETKYIWLHTEIWFSVIARALQMCFFHLCSFPLEKHRELSQAWC